MTALLLGFFAAAWFGWGHAAPTGRMEIWLDIGATVALLVAGAGAFAAFRRPAATAVLRDRSSARRYAIIVGIEFGLAGVGAGILGGIAHAELIPVWVCAVVGIHFFPLAPVLRDRLLVPLGVLMTMVALAALVLDLATDIAASTVTGVGAGVLLLAYATVALFKSVTGRRAAG